MKIVLALATLAFGTTAAHAFGPADSSFSQAGYAVQVSHENGKMLLTGRSRSTHATFRLVVSSDNHVTGTWNGEPVDMVVGAHPAKLETIALAGQ